MSNFDISSIVSIPVLALCFIVGYVIKNYTRIPNKYIPLISLVVGSVSSVVIAIINNDASRSDIVNIAIAGAVSGLASTGSYEFIVNMFGLKNKKTDEVAIEDNEESVEELVEESSENESDKE